MAKFSGLGLLRAVGVNEKCSIKGTGATVRLAGIVEKGTDEACAEVALTQVEAVKVTEDKFTTASGKVGKNSYEVTDNRALAAWCRDEEYEVGENGEQPEPEKGRKGRKAKATADVAGNGEAV